MDRELRDLHRGAREERRALVPDPDPHDVSGHDRATRIDDPVPDAKYGDERPEPALGYPEQSGEEYVEIPIPDGMEYDIDDLGDGRLVVQWWQAGPEEGEDHA